MPDTPDHRFDLCPCGFPRWRHPADEEQRKIIAYTEPVSRTPHHLFMDAPDVVILRRGDDGRFQKVEEPHDA